jgi:hypothetical protein
MHTPSRLERIMNRASEIALIMLALSAAGFWASMFVPAMPVTSLTLAVETGARSGSIIRVHVTYCKSYDLGPSKVRWTLKDGITIMLSEAAVTLPVGCGTRVVPLPVSAAVMPGPYVLQVEGFYSPWPWREDIIRRDSAPFMLEAAQ